ncbi:MAG: branched-chain amino acid aminotransferase [Rhodospirillales bacterium]|nr:branched-chain amino acid aminotransferase [Rhodospirillales bacterium]
MALIPYDDRDGFIWMDGKMLPWREARLHYLTHALHYGTQVFEGERAYNGQIFKSREHSERLHKSAEIIYMDMPVSVDKLEDIKREVLKANGLENAYIRAAAWRGAEQMGIDVTGTLTHVAVAAWDWGSYFDPAIREKGISLKTSDWRKPAPNTAPTAAKTASLYNLSCMVKVEVKKAGYNDALMLDYEGFVAESTGANLFAVKNGVLHTPIADRFLNGITRQTVMAIARNMDIKIEERRIKPEELETFEEIFLTGTAAELTAVGKIDDKTYEVGPVTRKLHEAYEDLTHSHSHSRPVKQSA